MTWTAKKPLGAVSSRTPGIAALIEKIKALTYFKIRFIVSHFPILAEEQRLDYLTSTIAALFSSLRAAINRSRSPAVKRNTMDNGATVLDILGGDINIGLQA